MVYKKIECDKKIGEKIIDLRVQRKSRITCHVFERFVKRNCDWEFYIFIKYLKFAINHEIVSCFFSYYLERRLFLAFRKCFRCEKMKIDREPYSSVSTWERDIHLKKQGSISIFDSRREWKIFILHGVSNFRPAKM